MRERRKERKDGGGKEKGERGMIGGRSRKRDKERKMTMVSYDGDYDDDGAMVEIKMENRSVRTMGCPPNSFNSLYLSRHFAVNVANDVNVKKLTRGGTPIKEIKSFLICYCTGAAQVPQTLLD